MKDFISPPAVFLCPGEKHPISRAMHLARMAEFFSACRNCEHRNETGTLSEKMVKRLKESWASGREPAGFHVEGFGGILPDDLTPSMARQVAAAFGLRMQRIDRIGPHPSPLPKGEGVCSSFPRSCVGTQFPDAPASAGTPANIELSEHALDAGASPKCVPTLEHGNEGPIASRIVVAGDGRSILPEFLAAVCEGLRWAACEAIDLGPATSAAMQFAVAHFQLAGGILLGSMGEKPQSVCMKFWGLGPHRMLGKSSFQPMEEILERGLDRPARAFGPQHRLQVETSYLAALAERFHGLRPLRFVVDATSRPWVAYLEKLLQTTACRIIPCRVLPQDFSGQIAADQAHFGVKVKNDGENCVFFDENGSQIDDERILNVFTASECKNDFVPPDALTKMAEFLQLLSRDDRPCSEVLDDLAKGK